MMKQNRECDRNDFGYPVLMIDLPKNTEATKQISKSYKDTITRMYVVYFLRAILLHCDCKRVRGNLRVIFNLSLARYRRFIFSTCKLYKNLELGLFSIHFGSYLTNLFPEQIDPNKMLKR